MSLYWLNGPATRCACGAVADPDWGECETCFNANYERDGGARAAAAGLMYQSLGYQDSAERAFREADRIGHGRSRTEQALADTVVRYAETIEAVANEIGAEFKHTARADSLRIAVKALRDAVHQSGEHS